MQKVKLKEANIKEIKIFFKSKELKENIQGIKLKALYYLIQKKGEAIETKCNNLKGVKALNIGGGYFISLKRSNYLKESFYPCTLKPYYWQELKNTM